MTKIACKVCNKSLKDCILLYRVNRTGEPVIWVCENHAEQEGVIIDPEVEKICNIIAEDNKKF